MPGTFCQKPLPGFVAALFAFAFASLFSAPAAADICSDLRAELRQARNSGGASISQIQRYTDAALRQAEEIRKTTAMIEARGCYRNPDATCQQLLQTARQMKSNLSELQRQRDRLASQRNAGLIRSIEARLEAYRCNDRQQIVREAPSRPSITLVPQDRPGTNQVIIRDGKGPARILGVPEEGADGFENPNAIAVPQLAGTFRTLCVRTCDGYYFPVSFSTGSAFFQRDAEACSAMCPATQTRLYFHRVPEEESEAMISLQGEPYTALPTAFLYRQRPAEAADPSCTCGKPVATASAAQQQSIISDRDLPSAVPTPRIKPEDGLADPETQMNASGRLTADRVRELTGAVTVGDTRAADGSRKVRVVGPEFLPDPEEAIDLQSPAPTAVQ